MINREEPPAGLCLHSVASLSLCSCFLSTLDCLPSVESGLWDFSSPLLHASVPEGVSLPNHVRVYLPMTFFRQQMENLGCLLHLLKVPAIITATHNESLCNYQCEWLCSLWDAFLICKCITGVMVI